MTRVTWRARLAELDWPDILAGIAANLGVWIVLAWLFFIVLGKGWQ